MLLQIQKAWVTNVKNSFSRSSQRPVFTSCLGKWVIKKSLNLNNNKFLKVLKLSISSGQKHWSCALQPFNGGSCLSLTRSWIQLNVTWLYWQRAAHLSQWRAIVRGSGEVLGVREVSQRQQPIMLHCGAPTALLNHAVQLQLRGPVKHLTLIWERNTDSQNNHHPHFNSVSKINIDIHQPEAGAQTKHIKQQKTPGDTHLWRLE